MFGKNFKQFRELFSGFVIFANQDTDIEFIMMLKMRRYIALFVAIILVGCTSCTNYRQINIMSVKISELKLNTTSRATVTLKAYIDNPLNKEISLIYLGGKLYKDQAHFANVEFDDLSIAPNSKGEVFVNVTVDFIDPLALFSSGFDMLKLDQETFRLDGKAMLKSDPGGKRSFKFKNVTFNQIIERL